MPIVYQKWITRQDLRDNPKKIYIFGDNTRRVGMGGQAKEMRGEPNALGVATKWVGDNAAASFFSDTEGCMDVVTTDMAKVYALLIEGVTVVVPEDGIGTGLSRLPELAPKLDAAIKQMWLSWAVEFGSAITFDSAT